MRLIVFSHQKEVKYSKTHFYIDHRFVDRLFQYSIVYVLDIKKKFHDVQIGIG